MLNEKEFKEKYGNRNPFTVPEGYFEKLQADVMAKIPEKQAKVIVMKPRRSILRPLAGVAASVCILVCGFAAYTYFNKQQTSEIAQGNTIQKNVNAENVEAEDYIMMDNEAMYTYMMEQ